MATSIGHLPRWLSLAIVSLLCIGALAPITTVGAQSGGLAVGGSATVAYTGGAGALLRDAPTYDGAAVLTVAEGDTVTLLEGPLYDNAGIAWYGVDSWGTVGYLPSAVLAPVGTTTTPGGTAPLSAEPTTPATGAALDPAAATADLPDAAATLQPGTALVTNTNNDGARCRVAADYASDIITVLSEGTVVTLADVPLDVWQPVWCAEQYGYVHTDFITYAVNEPLVNPDALPTAEATTPAATGELEAAQAGVPANDATGAITGYATIVGTNGEGVRCRSIASYDSSTVTVLAEGTSIGLRGWNEGDWAAVVCGGINGYVHAAFISTDGVNLDTPAPTDNPAPANGGESAGVETGYAMVMRTNGDGLRCRSGASYDASTITVLAEGSQVALRGALQGEWQPVNCAGMGGYAHAGFLSSGAGVFLNGAPIPAPEQSSDSGSAPAVPDSGNAGGPITHFATVVATNGDGLFCRAAADDSSDILLVMPEGSVVGVNGTQQGDWMPVVCGNQAGFAHAGFLSVTNGTATPAEPVVNEPAQPVAEPTLVATTETEPSAAPTLVATTEPTGEPSETPADPGLVPGDHALVNGSLNLRYEATFSAGVAAVAPSGTVVAITDGPVNGFYRVDWDGLGGWMYGEYLTWTDQAASERGGSGEAEAPQQPDPIASEEPAPSQEPAPSEAPAPAAPSNPASSSLVSYAMQYLGYPYVWAGAGPYAFDCSGFTMYVVQNTLGKSITHDMATQFAMGMPVSQSELQPGDLVFFQNTFQWGLSHVGIYIGGGQFIHAENETTGVVISDLNSSYYSSRWYGAVRYV